MRTSDSRQSTLLTAIGALVALVAIVGTQFLGWEWGGRQLVPTVLGVAVAGVAVVVAVKRRLS